MIHFKKSSNSGGGRFWEKIRNPQEGIQGDGAGAIQSCLGEVKVPDHDATNKKLGERSPARNRLTASPLDLTVSFAGADHM